MLLLVHGVGWRIERGFERTNLDRDASVMITAYLIILQKTETQRELVVRSLCHSPLLLLILILLLLPLLPLLLHAGCGNGIQEFALFHEFCLNEISIGIGPGQVCGWLARQRDRDSDLVCCTFSSEKLLVVPRYLPSPLALRAMLSCTFMSSHCASPHPSEVTPLLTPPPSQISTYSNKLASLKATLA